MSTYRGSTLMDQIVPATESRSANLLRDALLVIGFSILLAVSAQFSFVLPFTPVPFTLQTLVVLLAGAALGSKRGAIAVGLYLVEGLVGFPFFQGGASGLSPFMGATGGYLLAFPIAAFVTGWLCERGLDRSFLTSALAMLPGTLIIYALGVTWLANVLHVDFGKALAIGMFPFIPGDLFKLIIATALLPLAWKIVGWARPAQQKEHQ